MPRLKSHLQLVLALSFSAAALGACSKMASPPGGFGVNVTVDATKVSAAARAKITSGTLRVASNKAGAAVVTRMLDLHTAIQGGTVRFHYTPGADATAGDALTFELDATGVSAADIIASGTSAKTTLAATAVSATIVLEGAGDGGVAPGADAGGDGGDGASGKGNGVACLTGGECASTFCADGVCCNETCTDVCVSCNQTASKGTCTPYAVGMDPEMECAAKLPVAPPSDDGGATDATDDAAGDTAPTADAAAAEAGDAALNDAAESDAATITAPDGGFMTMPNACAGSCSGARACNYPGATKQCGTPFCNSRRETATFVCDGNGGCGISLSSCMDYACGDTKGTCRTTCAAHLECLADDYCSGDNTCKSKKGNGISCATPDECASGNCSGGAGASVCCNTACDGTGLTCLSAGHVGQCQCMGVTCAAGVACQVFYQDADHDTFGNASGTIAAGTAQAGCAGAPPTGFVADHTDCDDGDANAHPGQTAFFGTPTLGAHNYDYDCDKATTKETPEYPGGVCRFCGAVGTCSTPPAACASGQTGSFQCPQENDYRIITTRSSSIDPSDTIDESESAAEPAITPAGPVTPRLSGVTPVPLVPIRPIYQCCGCQPSDKTGFVTTVSCGDSTQFIHTCGGCNTSTGGALGQTIAAKQQRCR